MARRGGRYRPSYARPAGRASGRAGRGWDPVAQVYPAGGSVTGIPSLLAWGPARRRKRGLYRAPGRALPARNAAPPDSAGWTVFRPQRPGAGRDWPSPVGPAPGGLAPAMSRYARGGVPGPLRGPGIEVRGRPEMPGYGLSARVAGPDSRIKLEQRGSAEFLRRTVSSAVAVAVAHLPDGARSVPRAARWAGRWAGARESGFIALCLGRSWWWAVPWGQGTPTALRAYRRGVRSRREGRGSGRCSRRPPASCVRRTRGGRSGARRREAHRSSGRVTGGGPHRSP